MTYTVSCRDRQLPGRVIIGSVRTIPEAISYADRCRRALPKSTSAYVVHATEAAVIDTDFTGATEVLCVLEPR